MISKVFNKFLLFALIVRNQNGRVQYLREIKQIVTHRGLRPRTMFYVPCSLRYLTLQNREKRIEKKFYKWNYCDLVLFVFLRLNKLFLKAFI